MFEKIRSLKPLGDRLLVEREKKQEKTAGGIFIPESAQEEKVQLGVVVATGQGRITADGKLIPLAVKAGDKVFFGKYSGTEAGAEHVILREDEVLGVI